MQVTGQKSGVSETVAPEKNLNCLQKTHLFGLEQEELVVLKYCAEKHKHLPIAKEYTIKDNSSVAHVSDRTAGVGF